MQQDERVALAYAFVAVGVVFMVAGLLATIGHLAGLIDKL